MTIVLVILVLALAVAGFLFRDKIKALLTEPIPVLEVQTLQLFTRSGYSLAAQVPPEFTYIPSLTRGAKNVSEFALAGWYLTATEAVQNGPLATILPPFGGSLPPTTQLQTFKVSVQVRRDGTFVPGSWSPITVA